MKKHPRHELIVRAIVLDEDRILVNQSENKKSGLRYCALPGGHVDPGESCAEALRREFNEELDCDLHVHDMCFVSESVYDGRKKNDDARHEVVLYFHATPNGHLRGNGVEVLSPEKDKNFRWLPLGKMESANLLPMSVCDFLHRIITEQEGEHYVFEDSREG